MNLVVRKHSLFDLMKIDHDFGGDNGYDHYDEQRANNCKTGKKRRKNKQINIFVLSAEAGWINS